MNGPGDRRGLARATVLDDGVVWYRRHSGPASGWERDCSRIRRSGSRSANRTAADHVARIVVVGAVDTVAVADERVLVVFVGGQVRAVVFGVGS